MASSRRRRGAKQGSTRQVQWLDSLVDMTIPSNNLTVLNLTGNLGTQERKGTTVIRTIVDLQLRINTVDTINIVDMGILLGDATAVLGGHLAQPEVQNDQPGWCWRTRKISRCSDIDDYAQYVQIQMDTKVKRKFIGNERDYLFVINNAGGASITFTGIIRVLIKKP